MSLGAAFPRTFALEPETLTWDAPFDWAYPDLDLLDALWTVQASKQDALDAFWSWTEAMVEDLKAARAGMANDGEADGIDCARFITCMPALHQTRSAGQMGDCYNWIWTAIAPTHVRGQRVNENVFSFLVFPKAPQALYALYLDYVPNFVGACYYVAYKLGGLDQLTAALATGAWTVTTRVFALNPADDAAVEAMVQMLIWGAHRDWPDAPDWAAHLLSLLEGLNDASQRKLIAMAFVTPAHRYSDMGVRARADWILATFEGALTQHERVQILAVGLDQPQDWAERREVVLAEIAALRKLYLNQLRPGENLLEVLELRVSILWPLVYSLVLWGEIGDLTDLLGAWYRAEGAPAADADLLAIVPTHNGGAGFLWPGGRWVTGVGEYTTHDRMQRASSAALGSYYRGTDGDHPSAAYQDFRFDVVNAEAGYELEDAMRAHYRFEALKARLPQGWSPRAILVFPAGPEPISAVLAKDTGIQAPLEISFEAARPFRPMKTIAVWAGGPWHEGYELEAIHHVAKRAGWTVVVHAPEAPTAEDLRRFYEDTAADMLWVISHGAHDPFAAEGTGLNLADEAQTLIDLNEFESWHAPDLERRLLVLNSCSGATAQGRGGLARIGLAHSLVGGAQGVVGHLWPVHWSTGLAFGAALATCLEHQAPDQAVLAATDLLRRPVDLMALLEVRFEGCEELLDRLRRSSEDLESLTNWGCPVLLA